MVTEISYAILYKDLIVKHFLKISRRMVIPSMSSFYVFDLGSFLTLFEPEGVKNTVKLDDNSFCNKVEW